jgi:hypothetical protein
MGHNNTAAYLEKSPLARILAQAGPEEAMGLNCWMALEPELFEVPRSQGSR